MSEIMTETDLDGHEDQADGAEVKARRAHRRVNPLPAEPVSAELPPPPTTLSIAEGRRRAHVLRLQHDLEQAQVFTWPMNPSCSGEQVARLREQQEQGAASIAARLAATEALSGWQLVKEYKADEAGVWRG